MPNQIGFEWVWWILLQSCRDDRRRDNSKRQAISSQTYGCKDTFTLKEVCERMIPFLNEGLRVSKIQNQTKPILQNNNRFITPFSQ
jgi:hypothetical protein